MSLNLTEQENGLIAYARSKFAAEPCPFAPALRPVREVRSRAKRSAERKQEANHAPRQRA